MANAIESADRNRLRLTQGECVYQEGSMGDGIFVVLSGEIRLVIGDPDAPLWIESLTKGDFFGEDAVLGVTVRVYSAMAHSESEVIRIPRATFLAMIEKSPEISTKMIRRLSERHRNSIIGSATSIAMLTSHPTPALPTTDYCLVSVKSGRRFPLHDGHNITIGRMDPILGIDPDVDLTSEDPKLGVSRHHAIIARDERGLVILEAPGVANGTYVDGKKVQAGTSREIMVGSTIMIASIPLILERTANATIAG